jgi:hypothetical protein
MTRPLMKCGCAANGYDAEGNNICVIHYGLTPDATEPQAPPELAGRYSKCIDCGSLTPSSTDLAFFSYRPTKSYDDFYDGCRGWD